MRSRILTRVFPMAAQMLVSVALLFACAGTFDWPWVWAYLGLGVLLILVNLRAMPPELMERRGEVSGDAHRWDRCITTLAIPVVMATLATAGLDYRFVWTPPLRPWIQCAGMGVVALGNLLFTWAMASNRFFAVMMTIEQDRGHSVQELGPYRMVRHPGYAGYIASIMAMPLLFGSLWAFIPAAFAATLFVIRTYLEDRALFAGLEGYHAYSLRVRYRLFPGLW